MSWPVALQPLLISQVSPLAPNLLDCVVAGDPACRGLSALRTRTSSIHLPSCSTTFRSYKLEFGEYTSLPIIMSHNRPAQPGSPGSRGSASHMPVIAEDENSSGPIPARRGPIPRIPLRVPQKSYRRSNHRSNKPNPFVPDPHPLSEKPGEGSSSATTTTSDTEKQEDFLRKLDIHEQRGDFTNHRRRWLRLLLIVGLVVVILLALAIGLGVGLTNR